MKNSFEYQNDSFSCGSYAFKAAVSLLGINITIEESRALCKTKSYMGSAKCNLRLSKLVTKPVKTLKKFWFDVGTDPSGIKRAIRKVGFKHKEYISSSENDFKIFLDNSVKEDNPVILVVNYFIGLEDDTGHYVLCSKRKKEKYCIIDSAPLTGKVKQWYDWKKLAKRNLWYSCEDGYYYEFYGIAIQNKKKR